MSENNVNANIPVTENFSEVDAYDAQNPVDNGKELTPEELKKKNEEKAKKKAKDNALKQAIDETLATEGDEFRAKLRTMSPFIEVVNTLGYKDDGNMVQNKKDGVRTLEKTSKIVGYILKNNGKKGIPYRTEVFTKNEQGVWVGKDVEMTLKPGETIMLARKWMTLLTSQPEISFMLANGRMLRGSATSEVGSNDMDNESIDRELEAYYFVYNDKTKKVNDDRIKKNIGEMVLEVGADGKEKESWRVLPEYEATFGFLNNVKEKVARQAKNKAYEGLDNGVINSNYIHKLWEKKNNRSI